MSMSMTSMNIRMDTEVKQQSQKLFKEFGLDMTTAINMFLRQSIREQAIPFEMRLKVPNAQTREALQEAERMPANPDTKRYHSVDELFDELEQPSDTK